MIFFYQNPVKRVRVMRKHSYEAFDKRLHKNMSLELLHGQDVYAKNAGGHKSPIRFAQKLRWAVISLDIYYPAPAREMAGWGWCDVVT